MTSLKRHISAMLKSSAVVAVVSVSSQVMAMDPYVENMLVGFCKATMKNDVLKLNRSMRSYRMNYVTVAEKVVCNNQPIMTFAKQYGANDTYRSFDSRLPGRLREKIEIRDLSNARLSDDGWSVTFEVAH